MAHSVGKTRGKETPQRMKVPRLNSGNPRSHGQVHACSLSVMNKEEIKRIITYLNDILNSDLCELKERVAKIEESLAEPAGILKDHYSGFTMNDD